MDMCSGICIAQREGDGLKDACVVGEGMRLVFINERGGHKLCVSSISHQGQGPQGGGGLCVVCHSTTVAITLLSVFFSIMIDDDE